MNRAPLEATCRYSAFISYSHEDARWAKWLQSALEGYRIPRRLAGMQSAFGAVSKRLAPVFRDRSDMSASTNLGETIQNALQDSANLIVICSPDAHRSRWVNEEIAVFRRLGRGDRVFCVIVAGEPNASELPGREDEECFPPALRSLAAFEPIAADARPGGDGKANVTLKILAALLDVDFDVFKRREQRRRIRRMTLVTSLSVAMAVVTTGLAISARNSRDAAVQRQREAETLIDFMLGDLNNKLRQVQRLDILEAVDSQAMAYFTARPNEDLADQTLALRIKALQKIGNVHQDQGKLPAAMEAYRAAAGSAEELMRRAPGDVEREAAYAEILHHLGNAYWFKGDLDRALESFQKAIALLEHSQAARPSVDGSALLAYARINEGRVQEARGDLAAARVLYEDVLTTFRTLSSEHPGEIRWQSDLAAANDSLAKVAMEQGQLAQAIAGYRDVFRMRSLFVASSPDNRDAQEDLLLANAVLGNALALCGDDEAAMRHVRAAVAMEKELLAFDPTQGDWRFYLGKHSRVLGGIALGAGRRDEAASAIGESLQVFTNLVATDRTNMAWRRELARAQVESARLHIVSGDTATAEALLGSALAQFRNERAGGTADRSLPVFEAEALMVLGEAAGRRQDPASAREHWEAAREAIQGIAPTATDPYTLATWVRIHLLLGESTAAHPALEALGSMGYRPPEFDSLLKRANQPYRTKATALRCGQDLPGPAG